MSYSDQTTIMQSVPLLYAKRLFEN